MRDITVLSSRAAALAILAIGTASLAQAQQETTTLPFDVSGFVDLYYQYDFGRPDTANGSEANLRQFDTRHNRYRLSLGYVDLSRAPTDAKPFGFDLTLIAGPTADIIHGLEPGGLDSWRNFGQAFVSYRFAGKVPVQADFGKFWTPIGYEAVDSRSQDEYSRSFNYYTNQPLYHTGLRVSAPVTPQLSLSAYAVQGWNEVQDSNSDKSFILSASYAASPKLGLSLTGYQGREGSQGTGISGIGYTGVETDTTLADFIATYQLDTATKLAFNADYMSSKGVGKSDGFAVYAKRTIDARSDAALRLEHVEDLNGVRTGLAAIYHSITATYDYAVTSNLLFRFEAREDLANVEAFNSNNGFKKNRTTLTFAQVLKF